jgi:D-alanyl-D-alanine carboxypeptidase (penicillin-binding protein 5/6)
MLSFLSAHRHLPPLALLLAGILALASSAAPARSATPIPTAPDVDARAYIMVDFHTAKVLAQKEPSARMEPASLTKLMTAYIVFEELATGKLKLEEPITVSEHAWRSEGSRTFIELGKPVPVRALLLGMIVQSGNDATIALAEHIAGTEDTFVQLMNANAKRLGMVGTHFENSSGLPAPAHYTTARDMAQRRPERRRTEDRPYRLGRLLPRDVGAARWYASHLGRARLDQHEGPGKRERRPAQLRFHLL